MIVHHKQQVARTAHYYTIGKATKDTKYFILACHGYAQLAEEFIQHLEVLADESTFILAPEALSRFYRRGGTGVVGASWMTKENRLDEITDYSNYLQLIYDQYILQLSRNVRVILFGFSQGCATQCRWMMRNEPKFHDLILWGGFFPEDLDYHPKSAYFKYKKIHLVYGESDQFLTPERLKMHETLLHENNLKVQVHTFEGKHEVDQEILKEHYLKIIS